MTGTCKAVCVPAEYGFVSIDDGEGWATDYFFHCSGVRGEFPQTGDSVEFLLDDDTRRGGLRAVDVTVTNAAPVLHGAIRSYSAEHAYGFIAPDAQSPLTDGGLLPDSIFFHLRVCAEDPSTWQAGTAVTFRLERDRTNRLRAVGVRPV